MKKRTITAGDYRKIVSLKRNMPHKFTYRIHKKHRISKRTLFYMKEYGPKSHVATVIVRESLKMLLLASIISSIGGLGLKAVEGKILLLVPLLILLPALNGMIGGFGTIMSSKFTTMLLLGRVSKKWWRSEDVKNLVSTLFAIALIAAVYIGALAYVIAILKGFAFSGALFAKIILVSVAATALLTGVVMLLSIIGGLWIFRKKEDPNNFLIPITTSVADFGSLLILSALVVVFF